MPFPFGLACAFQFYTEIALKHGFSLEDYLDEILDLRNKSNSEKSSEFVVALRSKPLETNPTK